MGEDGAGDSRWETDENVRPGFGVRNFVLLKYCITVRCSKSIHFYSRFTLEMEYPRASRLRFSCYQFGTALRESSGASLLIHRYT